MPLGRKAMKAVVLWAGCGRRIQKEYNGLHKAMIPLCGRPLLAYLLDNIRRAGFEEIVPVLGYRAEELLAQIRAYAEPTVFPVYNPDFDRTNNLYSLLQARDILAGESFVVINGDMVFDYHILEDIRRMSGNAIAVDTNTYPNQIDSPRVLIQNERIMDIGRHRSIEEANGYAVGIYRFSKELSEPYFDAAVALCERKPEAGYHEPLEPLLAESIVHPCVTGSHLWMDVDEKADVHRAEQMLTGWRKKDESGY